MELLLTTHISVTDGDRNSLWVNCYPANANSPPEIDSLYAFSVNYRREYDDTRTVRQIRVGLCTERGMRVLSFPTENEMMDAIPLILFKCGIATVKLSHDPEPAVRGELALCNINNAITEEILRDVKDIIDLLYAPESAYVFK